MNGISLSVRRQDKNTWRRHDESRESNELPGLVKAYSSSSSHTSGTPKKSSGDVSNISRREKKRGNKKGHHRTVSAGNSIKKGHDRTVSSDSSILRGAEILRRQLLHTDDIDDNEALLEAENYRNIDIRKTDYPGARDPQEDDDDDDAHPSSDEWSDPWREPNADRHVKEGAIVPKTGSLEEPTEEAFDSSAQGDAADWAHLSDSEEEKNDDDTAELLLRASQSLSSPRSVSPDHTPETLRTKVQTYLVQRVDEMDISTFASSCISSYQPSQFEGGETSYLPGGLLHSPEPKLSTLGPPPGTTRGNPYVTPRKSWDDHESASDSHCHALNLLKDLQCDEEALQDLANEQEELAYLQEATKRDPNVFMMALPTEEPSQGDAIVSPRVPHHDQLMRDPAFLHAQRAGILWQSLVSQHVRFSSKWWNGARSPPLGVAEQMWNYTGRHRLKGDRFLNGLVRNRGSAGRLLLHIIIRDIMTLEPVQDISIGCFHPNARGVRSAPAFDPSLEDSRDIWLALRRRGDDASVVESLLKQHDEEGYASPLGGKNDVNNSNMRAVFGETSPVQTVFVVESELYELFSQHLDGKLSRSAILLQRFLPGW